MNDNTYNSVDASPVKRFFVEMLTRDIELDEAILDLLDNCVDGILRSERRGPVERPYDGFWAKITINGSRFEIDDNCGGIPWSLHEKAFRMGRPAPTSQSEENGVKGGVGVYGIGMKRAIFKMGRNALIWTRNGEDAYEIPITPEWMDDQTDWRLEVKTEKGAKNDEGTYISVEDLHQHVKERFEAEDFIDVLREKIAQHYAIILDKGFTIEVNKAPVKPNPVKFRFSRDDDANAVRPYMFRNSEDGIDIFLAVGLRDPIPGVDSVIEEHETVKYSSEYAGWTIVCNDRVVLYCDRSTLTGWGLFGIPRYHTQFRAISGIVEFRGDPTKLPTTTTKRGLNFSSAIYQRVLKRMQEGLRIFIDFTNKWKTLEREADKIVSPLPTITFSELKSEAKAVTFHSTRDITGGERFKPQLPTPSTDAPEIRISYVRDKKEVWLLAEELFEDLDDMRENEIPHRVGNASFEYTFKRLIENGSGD